MSKKMVKSNVSLIILLTLMFVIIIGILFKPTKKKHTPNKNIPPVFAQIKEPKFRKDGELLFLSGENKRKTISIEIAQSNKETQQGLMYRKYMEDSCGMLFKFDTPAPRSFWMKNTYISLDLIFIDENKTIIKISPNAPIRSIKSIACNIPAKYVVEVNAGFCQKYEITIGDKISF